MERTRADSAGEVFRDLSTTHLTKVDESISELLTRVT